MKFAPRQLVQALFSITDTTTREILSEGKRGIVTAVQDVPHPLVWVQSPDNQAPVACFPEELEAISPEPSEG